MKLDIIEGVDKGRVFRLDGDALCVIGRDTSCTVCLGDAESSRRHAQISFRDGQVFVEDLNSRNGTLLNGKPVKESALSEGDSLCIGKTVLQVSDLPAPDESQPPGDDDGDPPESRVLLSIRHDEADLLAGETSLVVDSAVLRENRILRKACEISNVVASGHDPHSILSAVLDRTKAVLTADTACILLWSEPEKNWVVQAASSETGDAGNVRVSQTIVQEAVNQGVAILSENALEDSRFDASQSILLQGISSAVCAPLKIDDKFTGALFVNRCNRSKALTPLDLRFAATVANMLGIFLEKTKFQEEFIKRERLAAVGQVIAGLAHYAKNIITGLRLGVGTMQRLLARQNYEGIGKCLETVASSERRLTDLLLDMLSYAKEREPAWAPVDLKKLVESVMAPYERLFQEQGIEVTVDCDPATPVVSADETGLYRVFLNLFLNAIDVLKEKTSGPKHIQVSMAPTGADGQVEIRFHDTGCGIAPEHLPSIFAVFFSTKGSRGTGLGLAVTHKIVQEHGGRITVDSRQNEWTEFTITIPVTHSAVESGGQQPPAPAASPPPA